MDLPLKYENDTVEEFQTDNYEIIKGQPTLTIKLEKLQVYEKYGQFVVYGSTISRLKKLHKNLLLPIRINSRTVKDCPHCPYKTLHIDIYKKHLKIKHTALTKEDLFYCFHCPYSHCNKEKLKVHLVSHQTIKSLECPYCVKMFKAKHSLNSHIKRIHQKFVKYYYCDTCSYKATTRQGLNSHKERRHVPDSERKEEYLCVLCSFKTNKPWSLQYHIGQKHTKRFECSKCTFTTPVEESFKQHVCKSYECYECGHKSIYRSHFKSHLARHRKPEELPLLKCGLCPFTTKSQGSFNSHKVDHKSNIDVKCPECALTVKKRSLFAHIKLKHSKEENVRYSCPHCDQTTCNKNNLKRHIETQHVDMSQLELLKCEQCSFATWSKGSMYAHQRHHSSQTVYKCEYCSFTTAYKNYLKEHALIHQERTKVTCDKCSKKFLTMQSLIKHMEIIHEVGKTYECDLCPEDFRYVTKRRGDLEKHMLRHKTKSELETFKCHECPFESKRKPGLAKHVRKVHMINKDKYHICTQCYHRSKSKESLERHFNEMHKETDKIIDNCD